ncbi:DUF4114 domain-containing protein [Chroococcus sp. FPU101]|uniref:DUF4114 domain-containing protein n=1 Tax=Chroococcus sp. FPU101 TaxID=1974212 RepID=UPI001A8E07A6|nr:DUF4114 domain-containing protein [Chroococcus sp. FPU101]GFE69469.1 hypothetical protein CFPU101_20790 [Chroococcus sp. FPU101]
MNTLLKKLAVIATAGTVCSLVGVESASAAAFNNRPVNLTNQGNPDSITTILNNINSGITNATTQQSNVALWSAASPNTAQSGTTLIIELAGLANSNRFGIYDANNRNNLIQIFEGNDVGNANLKEGATITFTPSGSGYNVTVTELGTNEGLPTTGFISSANFGFYINSTPSPGQPPRPNSGIFYTEDDENIAGSPQALVYGGTGSQLNLRGSETGNNRPIFEPGEDWILAWEDLYNPSDRDFNDMVLFVDNVGAVPEPLTMLGAGAAAGLGAFFKRQTAKKQKK